MENLVNKAIESYAFDHTTTEPDLLQELVESTNQTMGWPQKLSGRLVGRTLKLLAQLHQPESALEIGMFTGYSALSIAEGMPEQGKLICYETNPQAIKMAQSFFDRSPYGYKIEVVFGKAIEHLAALDKLLDFTFIDADKRNYLNYYHRVLELTRPGGIIILDNMLWSGNVLKPSSDIDEQLNILNKEIYADPNVENIFLTQRDGINIVRKRC